MQWRAVVRGARWCEAGNVFSEASRDDIESFRKSFFDRTATNMMTINLTHSPLKEIFEGKVHPSMKGRALPQH